MLHDDYTAAAALLQNDPQEGLRRLMELFGGPVHAICTAILRGHAEDALSLIHISEPTRLGMISYAVFCLKKKKK